MHQLSRSKMQSYPVDDDLSARMSTIRVIRAWAINTGTSHSRAGIVTKSANTLVLQIFVFSGACTHYYLDVTQIFLYIH